MKFFLICFSLSVIVISCGDSEDKKPVSATEVKPENASKNTDTFNGAMLNLLNGYDSLKSALVDYDSSRANAAATLVKAYVDSLPLANFPHDSAKVIAENAKNYAGTITTAATALIAEKELEGKKRKFQVISDAFYDMVRTVRYDRKVLYHQHCPMAFNGGEEGYWVSSSPEIVNPYLGVKHPKYKDAMLNCGDITDSLDFSRR